MGKILLYITTLFLLQCEVTAQLRVVTDFYTSKDGLAQNDVNDMTQDSCGFLWLATDDGISRFDGYSFVNHKISSNQFHCSLNNQYDQIVVDTHNNLWARNAMGQALLFNQSNHIINLFPDAKDNRGANYTFIKDIKVINENIWLIGKEKGAIKISLNNGNYEANRFCFSDSLLGTKVYDVVSDNDGNTWLLTNSGLGLLDKDAKKVSNCYYADVEFYDMVDCNTDLLFASNNGRIIKYDKLKKRYSEHFLPISDNIKRLYILNNDNVLLVGNNSISSYNIRTNNAIKPSTTYKDIQNSWQDSERNVWFVDNYSILRKYHATANKIEKVNLFIPSRLLGNDSKSINLSPFAYHDLKNGSFNPFSETNNQPILETSDVCRVFSTMNGVYWTRSSSAGFQKSVVVNPAFQFVHCANDYRGKQSITAVCEDNLERIWIGTSDKKVILFNSNNVFLGFLDKSGNIVDKPTEFGDVNTLYLDRKNNMWLGGTVDFYKLTPVNKSSFHTKNFRLDKNTPQGTYIKDILEDKNGHVWIATDGDGLQLLEYNENDYRLINRRNELKNSYPPTLLKTNCLYEDSNGNIWLGSNEGITIFSADIPQIKFLKFFFYNPENSNMTTSVVSGLFQDVDGKMWIASYGGGLLKTTKNLELGDSPEFIAYNKDNNKLSSDLVLSVDEDADGKLWVVTENSIIKFDKAYNKVESYCLINGLEHESMGRQIFTRTRNGSFILGSCSGYYVIDPKTVVNNKYQPPLVFTRFQLFNKDVNINSEDSPLLADINLADKIRLKHKQNVFSIEYSALDYKNTSGIEYAYKLDNFEENWNYVGQQRLASYTNLPPGEYVFRVKSTNGDGNWCDNDKTITIIVNPSFWQTGWAWLLYFMIAFLIIGSLVYAYVTFFKMRSKMQFEQEMSTMKMQFFTDISHELRTPLTLIDAPLENVLQNNRINAEDREQLETVRNNTKRMLRLLTQILDFRKLKSNKMRLKVEKTNIFQLVDNCCDNFRKMGESRRIIFKVLNNATIRDYWVDRDKMDTVMFNLLSNAFKFTPEGKKITVVVENFNNDCIIRVLDEGCGMPKDKLSIIFDRFSTLRPKSLTNQSGTGIGLSLVKEILDLHNASISVVSQEEAGSEFRIILKPGTAHFDEMIADISISDSNLPKQNATSLKTDDYSQKEDLLKLLVIEDNEELRKFVVSVLEKKYNVIEAENGSQGYEKTLAEMPDFVLSDIMMPVMDGIEYTKKVRQNEVTSHIPVVLLTAKTDMQSKVDCLKIGANDYITKPFSMVYLQARIENIITERKKIQEKYKNELLIPQIYKTEIGQPDQQNDLIDEKDDAFMKRVVDYINNNIDNPELSPEELANGIKTSRWNLSCKIKSLVGQTPVEFIKDIRLNKAAELIKKGDLNMTQIAYTIGMTDSRYFSRCFKQKYGMTPTEYKNGAI